VKSIFLKMLTSFLGIVLLSTILMLIILFIKADDFILDQKIRVMELNADRIYETASVYKNQLYDSPGISEGAAVNIKEAMIPRAESTQTIIWLVDETGRIISSSAEIPENMSAVDAEGYTYFNNPKLVKAIFEMENDVVYDRSFSGVLAENGINVRTTYIKKYEIEVFGFMKYKKRIAVMIHILHQDIRVLRNDIYESFVLPMAASVALSVLLIFFFARNISKPLEELNKAAIRVSQGDMKTRMKHTDKKDEIGRLARTFNNMINEIDNIEASRQRLLSDVAHELRTPLTTINGFIYGILDGTIPKKDQDRYLQIVRDETDRLNKLIHNMLVLSRMDMQNEIPELSIFNINKVIRKCIINFESLITSKNIDVVIDFQDQDTFVKANEDDMERVLINLLHNAIKFSHNHGKIRISTEKKKNKIVIAVKDEGHGIKAENLERIWERFYKGDESRGMDSASTGLGLSIVKSIINKHGETIEAYSEQGKGTEFIFTLQPADNN
jgi:signal transduction histidine kinase